MKFRKFYLRTVPDRNINTRSGKKEVLDSFLVMPAYESCSNEPGPIDSRSINSDELHIYAPVILTYDDVYEDSVAGKAAIHEDEEQYYLMPIIDGHSYFSLFECDDYFVYLDIDRSYGVEDVKTGDYTEIFDIVEDDATIYVKFQDKEVLN